MTTAGWIGASLAGLVTLWGWYAIGREILPDVLADLKQARMEHLPVIMRNIAYLVGMVFIFLCCLHPSEAYGLFVVFTIFGYLALVAAIEKAVRSNH